MYGFLPSSATRAEPLDWTRRVSDALAVVRLAPTDQVLNALVMMSSYAAAETTSFTNPTRGARDTKEYVALLTALDDAVGQWPLRMRQLLSLPPVGLLTAGAGLSGSLVSVPVRTPRGEALVFLLNVALHHLEGGLSYLARVRADTATTLSVSNPKGGSVAAPNKNAKSAALHFKQGVEALRWAEALTALPASPSAVVLQQLRAQLPLDVTLGMGVLCAAVAKYMYALSSASTKNKPDVLATLAFEAAQLPLPSSVVSSSSLQLLPSLLLAAYHYHKATWYYAHAPSGSPEMAEALGHVRYADTLLATCDAQWSVEKVHKEAEAESRHWWGHRLTSFLVSGRSSSKPKGGSAAATSPGGRARGAGNGGHQDEHSADAEDDASTPLKASSRYPHLHALLLGKSTDAEAADVSGDGTTDVVQVYPYVRLLVNDVCTALQQYERENRVVYFAKVIAADEVCRDVPDVGSKSAGVDGSDGVVVAAEGDVFASRAALFATLPSPADLQKALAQQEEVGQAQQALSRALQRVERDGRQLAAYVTPTAALEQALDALEALMPSSREWTSPEEIVVVAVDAVKAAANTLATTGAAWQEDHDLYVGDRCAPPAIVEALMADTAAWTERVGAALTAWKALRVPAAVPSRSAFVDALVPRSAEMTAYLEQVDVLSRDVRDVLAAEAGSVTEAQVRSAVAAVDKVKQRGTELLAAVAVEAKTRRRPSGTPRRSAGSAAAVADDESEMMMPAAQYEEAEAAILAMVSALQDAPLLVSRMEAATAQLITMQQKATITPLQHLEKVEFRERAPEEEAQGKGLAPRQASKGTGITAEADAEPTARRSIGSPASAPTAATSDSQCTQSSRKRSRDASPPPPSSSSDDEEVASVSSSQLEDAPEAAPAPAEGVTTAVVSSSLLSRMKANKARRQAESTNTTSAATKVAVAPSAPPPRVTKSPPSTAKKALKTEKTRKKR